MNHEKEVQKKVLASVLLLDPLPNKALNSAKSEQKTLSLLDTKILLGVSVMISIFACYLALIKFP